jgi:hypothetical protein
VAERDAGVAEARAALQNTKKAKNFEHAVYICAEASA